MTQEVKFKFDADATGFVDDVGRAQTALDALAATEAEFQRQIAEGRGYDELQVRLRGLTDTLIEFGGTPQQAAQTLSNLREAAKTTGLPLATLAKIAEKYADEAEQGIVSTEEMARVMRFAAASGERYEDAARMMGMAVKGSTDALRKLGPEAIQAADAIDRMTNPTERAAATQRELDRAMGRVERGADGLTNSINGLNARLTGLLGPGTDVVSMMGGAGGATGMAAAFTVGAAAATALGAAVLKTADEALEAFIQRGGEAKRIAEELTKSEKRLEEETGGLLYALTGMAEASSNNAARLDGVSGALTNATTAAKNTRYTMDEVAAGLAGVHQSSSLMVQGLGSAVRAYDKLNDTQGKAKAKLDAFATAAAWEQTKKNWKELGEAGTSVLGTLADGWDHLGKQADAYLAKIDELQKANPVYGPLGPDGSMIENWGELQTLYADQRARQKAAEEEARKKRLAAAAKHARDRQRQEESALKALQRARDKAHAKAEAEAKKHYERMARMAERAADDRIKAMEARARDIADARRGFLDDRSVYIEAISADTPAAREFQTGAYTSLLDNTTAAEVRRRRDEAERQRTFGLAVDPRDQYAMDDPVYAENADGQLRRQFDELKALQDEMDAVLEYGPRIGASLGQAFADVATGAKTASEAIAGTAASALDQVVPMFTAYAQTLVAAGTMNPWALFAATMALSALTGAAKNLLTGGGGAGGGRSVSPVQRTDSLQNTIRREREREDVEINVVVQMGTERLSEAMVRTTARANRFGQLRPNRPRA